MDTGVATRPIEDIDAYRERLAQFVYHSGLVMRPVFAAAKARSPRASSLPKARTSACCAPRRSWSMRGSRRPILVGRAGGDRERIEEAGLRLKPATDFEIVNPEDDPRYQRVLDRVLPARLRARA